MRIRRASGKVRRTTRRDPEKKKVADKLYREKNREKILARRAVHLALKAGKINKVVCFCGNPKVEAHHEDHSKPLDIEWLCRNHHMDAEKRLRNKTIYARSLLKVDNYFKTKNIVKMGLRGPSVHQYNDP